MPRRGTRMNRLLAIVGWKNSGKTALVTRLVAELTARGHRVATIKHAHHAASMDVPGTDTFAHREAGAVATALLTDDGWALSCGGPSDLDEMIARLPKADIVLAEGFKGHAIDKIEARRDEANGPPLWPDDPHVIAVAHDGSVPEAERPLFDLGDIDRLADFIERHTGLTG